MNAKRRNVLNYALNLLSKASDAVSGAMDEEQDCLDNMPENLQSSDRYERMENAIDSLYEAMSGIDEVRDYIVSALE